MTNTRGALGPYYLNNVYYGDALKHGERIPDQSIDLIFTDPPYVRELMYTVEWLGPFANRVLKPTGFLMFYIGTYYKAIAYNACCMMDFWWEMAIEHGNAPMVWARNLFAKHKGVLTFRPSGGIGKPNERILDLYTGGKQSKQYHLWGQSFTEAQYFINAYSKPGDLVLDPFSGGGTTGAVCQHIGRRFLGFDTDIDAVAVSNQRLRNPFYQPNGNGQLELAFASARGVQQMALVGEGT